MQALIIALACVAALLGSFAAGQQWEQGVQAVELQKQRDAARIAAEKADEDGIKHAKAIDRLNAKIAQQQRALYGLTDGRNCLSAGAVRLLNAASDVPAAAGEPARSPDAFATDRDVGNALAICRGEHDKLSSQLNKILDIEDRRNQRP